MKKMSYVEKKTQNPVANQSFVTKFLQSVKQKMYGTRKFQCAIIESNNKATIFVIFIIGLTDGPAVSL